MAESVCRAAFERVEQIVSNRTGNNERIVIGLGTGSTIVPLAGMLDCLPANVFIAPTSQQSTQLILSSTPTRYCPLEALRGGIAVTVDGADAVDLKRAIIIKGGGAAHVQEKIVKEASDVYIIVVADESKLKSDLSTVNVPIEVLPVATALILHRLKRIFPTSSFSVRQSGSGKAGPVISDHGNVIIDARFADELFDDVRGLERQLRAVCGVVGTGIFVGSMVVFCSNGEGKVAEYEII